MVFEWFSLQTPLISISSLSLTDQLIGLASTLLIVFILARTRHDLFVLTPRRRIGLIVLSLLAVLTAQVAIVRFPMNSAPTAASSASAALFGLLPLLVAAYWLGVGPAILVATITGITWAVLQTGRLTQPLELAVLGAAVGGLLNQRYRGTVGSALRQPALSILIASVLIWWPVMLVAIFATGDLPALSNLELTLNSAIPSLLSAAVMALTAGLAVQMAIRLRPGWQPLQVQDFQVPPWEQHLSQRMLFTLVHAVILAMVLLVAVVALTSYRVATRFVVDQMARDATSAGSNIPLFIHVGRGLIGGIAQDSDLAAGATSSRNTQLEAGLRTFPFFQELIYIGPDGEPISVYPEALSDSPSISPEESTGIRSALDNAGPGEVITSSSTDSSVTMSFIAPVLDGTSNAPVGAVIGRTVLSENPILTPAVDILHARFVGSGQGFIVDSQNRIILYPIDSGRQQQIFELRPAVELPFALREGRAFRQWNSDGTRELIYILPMAGISDWSIVMTTPNEVALALASQISLPVLALLVLLVVVSLPLGIAAMRRVAEPLGQLLDAVGALAVGNLNVPVEIAGEDEIGRLGHAFDQMRHHLKDRLDEQERLLRVSRSVSASLELFRAMPPILSSALEVANAIGTRIVVKRGDSDQTQSYASGEAAAIMASLDAQLMDLVVQQGTVVISQLWRASGSLDTTALLPRIQALAAFPLRSDTSFHGVFWLAYDHEHSFEQSEMTFLSTLAGQAAVAIANARLFTEAQEERRKLEAVLESTADAMIVTDNEGRIILLNPAAEKYLGVEVGAAHGKKASEVIDLPDLAALLLNLQEPVSVLELPGRRGKTLLANASTIVSHDGTISGRVAVMRDITALKELDNIKTVFLRMVSHDLRSPLTYMRGYLSMLPLTGELNERQSDALEKIGIGIDSISDLTERLLYLSRLQFGEEAELELSLVDVEALINEVTTQQHAAAKQRDVTIQLDVEEKLPLLAADEMLYRQAIANLVSNAVKYTPDGGSVTVRAFQVKNGGDAQIAISVQDNGIGIREEDQRRLFEAFFRVPQREGEPVRPRGTGLGLALVKAIAVAHGGSVGVNSEFGHGSVFRITLPVRRPDDL